MNLRWILNGATRPKPPDTFFDPAKKVTKKTGLGGCWGFPPAGTPLRTPPHPPRESFTSGGINGYFVVGKVPVGMCCEIPGD